MNPTFQIDLEQIAQWPQPGLDIPQRLEFSPDSRWLSYLAPIRKHSRELALFGLNLSSQASQCLAESPPSTPLSQHEILRRERERQSWEGITAYQWAGTATRPLFLVPDATGWAVGSPGTPPGHVPQSDGGLDAALFADGSQLAFVRNGNLELVPVDGSTKPLRLTTDAEPGRTYGLADYISAEEFGRQRGFWIRPDGAFIALVEADVRHIPAFPIVHTDTQAPTVESFPYPFPGGPNAIWRLGIASSTGGNITWLDLGSDLEYLARVVWTPGGNLAALHLDRQQQHLTWSLCNPTTGSVRPFFRQSDPAYLNIPEATVFLSSGGALTTSESSGFCHLTMIDPDGTAHPLTHGPWTVTDILDVDEPGRSATILASFPDARQRQVLRVNLEDQSLTPITQEPGVHHGIFSPDHQWFADRHETMETSPQIRLYHRNERQKIQIGPAATTAQDLHLPIPERVEIAAEDGTPLYGALYRPSAGKAPYPLILSVYGGPHAQRVLDAWSVTVDLEAQYLAQAGFLVLKVDNRGSAHRGRDFEQALYRRFGTVEVEDQVRAAAWAVRFAGADPNRIGITGWSYGGYLTLMAMAQAPAIFRVGVAGAPVTDFRLYDTAYTERYMGLPGNNAEGYRQASVFTHLSRLPESLLIIHGVIDENVHFHQTLRLLEAALAEGRGIELMVLPHSRHLPRGQTTRYAIAKRRLEFLEARLRDRAPE